MRLRVSVFLILRPVSVGRLFVRMALALVAGIIAPCAPVVYADAVIRTQAMKSSTIAEYFVEAGRVRVELEIGLSDLEAFGNLLPDEIWEKLGQAPEPWAERWIRFVAEDLVITADGGRPLRGKLVEFVARDRLRRDDVTGEPLPSSGDVSEAVLFVRIEYPFGSPASSASSRPATLNLGGAVASRASIGFVVYHDAIAVNDFRYLGPEQTLTLDWADPWYTRFERRTLRRTYFASMNGFIYVEPYEVRKEIVLRPKDLEHWVDLGLAGRATIPVELQDDIKRRVGDFLRRHHPVRIDGVEVPAELAQINFLERSLRTSRVIDPPEELDINGAILGAIFVYPVDGLPQHVTMQWDLFNARIDSIPAAAVDQAGPLPTYLAPDFAVLEWQNFLKDPRLPTLQALATPPGPVARRLSALRWPLLVSAVVALGWTVLAGRRARGGGGRRAGLTGVLVLACAMAFWWGRRAELSDPAAGEIVGGLLHNIYLAHDYRDEGQIYDVLARSVEGDLLTDVYLDTRRGLELANQGGARAKVKEIALVELDAAPVGGGGFVANAVWVVRGSVGHWGHVHERNNRYRARLDVVPVGGAWKIRGLELLEEERL